MRFDKHSHLAGRHATLSASSYAWMNYDIDKLEKQFRASRAAQRGTELHALAKELIRLKQTLEDTGQTLNSYVNDAIGFRMEPEQVLFYSDNAYGTPDAISFRDNFLRVHDLKTGITETSFGQLEVYAAFFCLEYHHKPFELAGMEFRIYQNDITEVVEGDPDTITHIMETIKMFDKFLSKWRMEEE